MDGFIETSVKLIDNKLRFESRAGDNPALVTDFMPSDDVGYSPLELFLISLSLCMAATITPLLRKMRKNVSEISIKAQGKKRSTHPKAFEEITLYIDLMSDNATIEDFQKAVSLSEEKYCPVHAMVDKKVRINTVLSLNGRV